MWICPFALRSFTLFAHLKGVTRANHSHQERMLSLGKEWQKQFALYEMWFTLLIKEICFKFVLFATLYPKQHSPPMHVDVFSRPAGQYELHQVVSPAIWITHWPPLPDKLGWVRWLQYPPPPLLQSNGSNLLHCCRNSPGAGREREHSLFAPEKLVLDWTL